MKRLLDLTASLIGLLILSPLLLAVALAIRIRLGGPVLFVQERPGRDERPFRMVKFRTMREPWIGEQRELSDGARLTSLGVFLRRSSLDELPELWNVLTGDMSLVGPRPLLAEYLPYFTDHERKRFRVRPGITGLAQVRGRNLCSWDDRLAADVEYVERQSLRLDVEIMASTCASVLRAHAVVADARSVMLNFDEERRERARGAIHNGVRD